MPNCLKCNNTIQNGLYCPECMPKAVPGTRFKPLNEPSSPVDCNQSLDNPTKSPKYLRGISEEITVNLQYIIVEYSKRREVFVDNEAIGYNKDEEGKYHLLTVSTGEHLIRIGNANDATSFEKTVYVIDTDDTNPFRITL